MGSRDVDKYPGGIPCAILTIFFKEFIDIITIDSHFNLMGFAEGISNLWGAFLPTIFSDP